MGQIYMGQYICEILNCDMTQAPEQDFQRKNIKNYFKLQI